MTTDPGYRIDRLIAWRLFRGEHGGVMLNVGRAAGDEGDPLQGDWRCLHVSADSLRCGTVPGSIGNGACPSPTGATQAGADASGTPEATAEAAPQPDVHALRFGDEDDVADFLAGPGLSSLRPRLVVVRTNARASVSPWEVRIAEAGYRLCGRIGASRFYLAREHAQYHDDLLFLLGDDGARSASGTSGSGLAQRAPDVGGEADERLAALHGLALGLAAELQTAERRSEFLARRAEEATALHARSEARAAAYRAEVELLRGELASQARAHAEVLASRSWRITKPLRLARRLAGPEREEALAVLIARLGNGRLSDLLLLMLRPFPSLRRGVMRRLDMPSTARDATPCLPLSDRAVEILAALEEACRRDGRDDTKPDTCG